MKEQIFTERSVSLVNRNESTPILTEFWTCPVAPGSAAPAAYLRMMQDVGEQHLAACGYPMKDMLARGESMMRQPITPAALQPKPMQAVSACLPQPPQRLRP